MKFKIDRKLVPIKAHFFFFFAALGPILPQLNVFGRQLGVSPAAMGLVTAVLPLLWALAKPLFGYVVDYWPAQRKLIFMFLITIMSGSYSGLWFLPMPEAPDSPNSDPHIVEYVYKLNDTIYLKEIPNPPIYTLENYTCHWNCSQTVRFEVNLTNSTYINTIYVNQVVKNDSCSLFHMELDAVREGEVLCVPRDGCNLMCYEDQVLNDENNKTGVNRTKRATSDTNVNINDNHIPKDVDKLAKDKAIDNQTKTDTSADTLTKHTNKSIDGTNTNTTNNDPTVKRNDKKINNSPEVESNRTTEDKTKDNHSVKGGNNPKDDISSIDKTNKNLNSSENKSITDENDANRNNSLDKANDNRDELDKEHIAVDITKDNISAKEVRSKVKLPPRSMEDAVIEEDGSLYMTAVFWVFVVLMCLGTVAFNVANCIGDAVCFDVLGPEGGSKYGAQRAWGTAGYGLTALVGGWLVDAVSTSGYKDFTPAFAIALAATAIDLYSCRALTLPSLSSPGDSGAALRAVLKMPRVLVFISFAVVAGTFDSFIIYYMFWFLEEVAEVSGHTARIKLIEGVVVAGQSFVGELLFFYFSGKIIKRWGYGTTLTVSLLCYGVRMALISLIQNPWHLVFIESIMQGPTYALCYSSIVGYAAHVAPPGYSATVQGIVAGMDDGLGFALGSLLGGLLYARVGPRLAFRALAAAAVLAATLHAVLFACFAQNKEKETAIALEEDEKMLPAVHTTAIYRDTVEPIKEGER